MRSSRLYRFLRRKHLKGFSLIEMLMIIGLIGISTGLSIPFFQHYLIRTDLENAEQQVVQALYRAKLLSQSGLESGRWGFHVPSGTIFLGDSYQNRMEAFDEIFAMPESITVSGLTEVTYSPLTGLVNEAGTIVLTALNGDQREIEIDAWAGIAQNQNDLLAICHKDHAEYIPEAELPNHHAHGDSIGPCPIFCGDRNANVTKGVILLDPTSAASLMIHENAELVTPGFVMVNSDHAQAITIGNQAELNAVEIDVTGTPGVHLETNTSTVVGMVTAGASPVCDPFAGVPEPDPPEPTFTDVKIAGNDSVVLQPGTYIDGIQISGNGNVTMQPGLYYLQGGGFKVSGNGQITGNGIFIYNEPQSTDHLIDISGNGVVSLTPQINGPYKNITFFQDRDAVVPTNISANTNMNITGAIYVPQASVVVTGDGGNIGSLLISKNLDISGNGTFTVE